MKIKFKPLGLPLWSHRRADYMFTAGIGVGRQALFMDRGRDSLLEQHSWSKARMAALKKHLCLQTSSPCSQAPQIWHLIAVASTGKSFCGSKSVHLLKCKLSLASLIMPSFAQSAAVFHNLPIPKESNSAKRKPIFSATDDLEVPKRTKT